MQCPTCSIPLLMTERQGVEIDYCGQCRGVWLDRGELDKIIDRNTEAAASAAAPLNARAPLPMAPEPQHLGDDTNNHRDSGQSFSHKKRKDNFFSELFDF